MKNILLNLCRLPFWVVGLFTEQKSFCDNPIIGSTLLNKLGLHFYRVKIANLFAKYRRFFLKKYLNPQKRDEYHNNGYTLDFNFLNQDDFDEIKKEVFESIWPLREMNQGGTVTRRIFLNEAELTLKQPKLAAFINNPELLARIRYVAGVGGQPIFSIQAIFFEANNTHDPQMVVHADTFHPNAKAWFFLENVCEDDGPFAYVKGSHQLTDQRLKWERRQSLVAKYDSNVYHARGSFRATPEDLKEMGLMSPQKMAVPANTLVVADTFGFHCRSNSSHAACRVEIYATLRRNPFLPFVNFDIFSIPFIKHSSGYFSIIFLSFLAKVGLRKMPWRIVGEGKVKDKIY